MNQALRSHRQRLAADIANSGKTLEDLSLEERNAYKRAWDGKDVGFWTHYCNARHEQMSIEKGCECDWCGKRETC